MYYDLKDKERSGSNQPKKFNDAELQVLLKTQLERLKN